MLEQRRDFEFEVTSFFNGYGVDLRDHNIDIATVRSKVFYNLMFSKRIDEEINRVKAVSEDFLSTKMYTDLRMQEIERFVNNEEEFKETMKKVIEERFREKFKERYQTILEKSTEAHNIRKREFFKELKDAVSHLFIENISTHESLLKALERFEMEPVPMSFPKSIYESYLPPLVNAKYEEYKLNPEYFYTADLATTDDVAAYYQTFTPRFTKRSDLNLKDMKANFAKLYELLNRFVVHIEQNNKNLEDYESIDEYEVIDTFERQVKHPDNTILKDFEEMEKSGHVQEILKKGSNDLIEVLKKEVTEVKLLNSSTENQKSENIEIVEEVEGDDIRYNYAVNANFAQNELVPEYSDLSGIDSNEETLTVPLTLKPKPIRYSCFI